MVHPEANCPPIPLRYGVSDAYQGLPGKRFRQETIDTESQRTGRLEGSIREVLIRNFFRSHGEKGRHVTDSY